MQTTDLKGMSVLVTRPNAQAGNLSRLIEQAGGKALMFPVLTIIATDKLEAMNNAIDRLDDYTMAIFISPNAVKYAIEAIHGRRGRLPATLKLACVGQGSANELERHGYTSAITPYEQSNSEGLLSQPALQNVKGEKIAIFRGNGGRDLLRKTLDERGALVDYIECYRRAAPDTDITPLVTALRAGDIHLITMTSSEGLENLCRMAGADGRAILTTLPIVVISPRIAQVAHQLGFQQILLTGGAGDEAILDTAKAWQRAKKNL